MRISVKGRYALAAAVEIARNYGGENVAAISVAQALGISKIYLEQVFAQLKKENILLAVKGARGGYQLAREPSRITAWEVLSALESVLAEPTESTVGDDAPELEAAMNNMVFRPLDNAIARFLSGVTIQDLLDDVEKQKNERAFMPNM